MASSPLTSRPWPRRRSRSCPRSGWSATNVAFATRMTSSFVTLLQLLDGTEHLAPVAVPRLRDRELAGDPRVARRGSRIRSAFARVLTIFSSSSVIGSVFSRSSCSRIAVWTSALVWPGRRDRAQDDQRRVLRSRETRRTRRRCAAIFLSRTRIAVEARGTARGQDVGDDVVDRVVGAVDVGPVVALDVRPAATGRERHGLLGGLRRLDGAQRLRLRARPAGGRSRSSTIGMTSSGFTSPTMAIVMFDGT